MGTQTQPRQLISVAEAARYAAVSADTIHRYLSKGQLTGYRIGNRGWIRVDMAEMETLFQPMHSGSGGHDAAA